MSEKGSLYGERVYAHPVCPDCGHTMVKTVVNLDGWVVAWQCGCTPSPDTVKKMEHWLKLAQGQGSNKIRGRNKK